MHRTVKMVMLVAAVAAIAITGLAIAKTARDTLKTAHNSTLGETVVVGHNGHTLYELRPETRHHLLCKSTTCFQFWPPLTVKSAHTTLRKAHGIRGRLAILHRHGFFQVTLGGRPVYFFSGDHAKGQANGQGLMTFGGTWHVVKATSSSSTPPATTSTTTTTPGTTSTMPSTTTTTPYPY